MLEQMLQRAASLRNDAAPLMSVLSQEHKQLVAVIIAHTVAGVLEELALPIAKVGGGKLPVDEIAEKRKIMLERNHAIRSAAASGNWTEFDRLTGIESTANGVKGPTNGNQ